MKQKDLVEILNNTKPLDITCTVVHLSRIKHKKYNASKGLADKLSQITKIPAWVFTTGTEKQRVEKLRAFLKNAN